MASVNATASYLGLKSNHKVLMCLDPNFVAATMMVARCLVLDMDLIIQRPSSNPLLTLNEKVDFVSLVPFQIYQMMEDANIESLNEIQNILIGGAPLSPVAFKKLSQLQSDIYLTYGMTETVSHIALMPIHGDFMDASFQVLPDVQVSQGEDGCLQIIGRVTQNQLIHTNDMVEFRSKHQFRWLGRKDFIINSGGIKIHPEQIERLISEILDPDINFMISWKPDDKLGAACLLLSEGKSLNSGEFERIQAHVSEKLSKYYSPRACVSLDRFERTASGKLLREQTRLKALKLA